MSASGLQDTSSWAPLGLLLAPFGLLLGSSWPPLGPSWLPFGFLWAPLRRSGTRFLRAFLWVSPWELYCRPRRSKKPSLWLFLVPLGLLLAPLGLVLACSWRLWAPLGLLLASSWLLLGFPETLLDSIFTNVFVGLALGPVFSASGLQKTSSWAVFGLLLASSWLLLGSSWLALGSSWPPLGLP